MRTHAIDDIIHGTSEVQLQKTTAVPAAIRDWLVSALPELPQGVFVDLWDSDRIWVGRECGHHPRLIVRIKHPGVMRALLLSLDPLVLVEAYLNKLLEFEGTLEDATFFIRRFRMQQLKPAKILRACLAAFFLPACPLPVPQRSGWSDIDVRSPERDAAVIQHHYDVGNEFYKLFLDPLLVYSSAYFDNPEQSLDKAQERKLDITCQKLKLEPGERLLDIGCGWGALLRFAARNYGVKGYGITLSKQQLEFNRARINEEGLSNSLQVELKDYRELPTEPTFDKITSVGMIEHVGIGNYPIYFQQVLAALKPGGLFLNQGIATYDNWDGSGIGERFIDKYIFPDGNLARLSAIIAAAEDAQWETVHLESWRPHYVRTLRKWTDNLTRVFDRAVLLVGSRTAKLWLVYLVGSMQAFEENKMNLYSILFRRQADRIWKTPVAGWT